MKLNDQVNIWIDPILLIQTRGKNINGTENDKSKFVPIHFLLWTIRDLLQITNGCSGIVQSETDDFTTIFDKKFTFRQLSKFLKKHKEFVVNKNVPQVSCLCEICDNMIFLAKSMSPKLNLPI